MKVNHILFFDLTTLFIESIETLLFHKNEEMRMKCEIFAQ